jgi:hypothetical protein
VAGFRKEATQASQLQNYRRAPVTGSNIVGSLVEASMSNLVRILALLTTVAGFSCSTRAQPVIDGGFENYTVSPGGFVQPSSGPWSFTNDAGVVEPFSPNSSTGPLDSWSATRAAYQGQQYASTYAGADQIRQAVTFTTPGVYQLSVRAFAPAGALTMPGVFTNASLTDGQFRFWFGTAATGSTFTVPAGSDWAGYTARVTVPAAGVYDVGATNWTSDKYFINYDDFGVTPVPEPAGMMLMTLLMILWHSRPRL